MENWKQLLSKHLENRELPIYICLCKGIKELVMSEKLIEGQQMPTVRGLAGDLGINNGTVARAYQKLEQEGWLFSQTGRGTFVKLSSEIAEAIKPKESWETKLWIETPSNDIEKKWIDLAASTPSADLFPVVYFKEAMNTVLDREGGRAFGYHEGLGYYPLREAICDYLQGLEIDAQADSVQITTGAQQGVDLIARALIRQGDVIYMERPSYTGAIGSFTSHGAILIDIPMDMEGMDPNALENLVRKKHPRLVYIMPNYQSPTGLCYSNKRRAELLELAEKYDFYLLEDDYLGELRFQGTNKRPIKAMDKSGRVIYVKSFSKLFMPGLRLGFTVLPLGLRDESLKAKHYTDISTDGLTQRTFDLYLRSGRWKGYLEDLRSIYSIKHDKLGEALSRYEDILNYTPPQGGLTYWVSYMPMHKAARFIAQTALEKGLKILSGERFYIHHREENKFRLGFANVETDDIDRGIDILAKLIMS